MILFLAYLILLWSVNAWHDSDYYNKKSEHLSGAFLSCFIGLGFIAMPDIKLDFWNILNLVILVFTIRWVVFDIVYNLLIKQDWYFVGSTATLDKMPNWLQFSLKIFLIFISIPIFISFLNQIK